MISYNAIRKNKTLSQVLNPDEGKEQKMQQAAPAAAEKDDKK